MTVAVHNVYLRPCDWPPDGYGVGYRRSGCHRVTARKGRVLGRPIAVNECAVWKAIQVSADVHRAEDIATGKQLADAREHLGSVGLDLMEEAGR